MIYTLTVNPAIDYVIGVNDFCEGVINRTISENIYAGGKGINVSVVLSNLGIFNTPIVLLAGSTGEMYENMLSKADITADLIRAQNGLTRINVKMHSYVSTNEGKGSETEINGKGPIVGPIELESIYNRVARLSCGDILVLSGSVPKIDIAGYDSNCMYANICSKANERGVDVVVDTTGKQLMNALKYEPLLIKPNIHELGEIFDTSLTDENHIIDCAKKLQRMGARNVLVSMADKGAILLDRTGAVNMCSAPYGRVVNSVGAGDTMVAAFLAAYSRSVPDTRDYSSILRCAVAAGSATAFGVGLATKEDIDKLMRI